jgi:hypothetical protein
MRGREAVSYLVQLPPREPAPVPDCATCTALHERRERARAASDYSRVSDCNVRLRQHDRHPPISR